MIKGRNSINYQHQKNVRNLLRIDTFTVGLICFFRKKDELIKSQAKWTYLKLKVKISG
jgi:hypothetical protein